MKGLLLKDVYLAWTHFKIYLFLLAAITVLSVLEPENSFLVFYPCMLCGMMPVNLMAYDERSKWDVFSALLPFSRAQIVASKYLFGLMIQGIILSLVAVFNVVRMIFAGGVDWKYLFDLMGLMVMIASVSVAVPLPFVFRNGVEKGRMGYYVMIALFGVCTGAAGGLLGDEVSAFSLPNFPAFAVPVMVLVGIGAYALSWRLSVKYFEIREL